MLGGLWVSMSYLGSGLGKLGLGETFLGVKKEVRNEFEWWDL